MLARPDHYCSSIPNEPLERHDETAADPGKVSLRGVVCRGVSSRFTFMVYFDIELGYRTGLHLQDGVACLSRPCPTKTLTLSKITWSLGICSGVRL